MAHALFSTAFGVCGLAWNDSGLTGFQLPEESPALTEAKIAGRHPVQSRGAAPATPAAPSPSAREEPPAWIAAIIERVQNHLNGALQDFADLPLDWSGVSEFQQAVYRRTLAIQPGRKRSYGEIARQLSHGPEAARAVGVALGNNPWPLLVPCHRVVSASDKMTGFSAPGGIRTKTRLLVLEGAELLSE